MKTILIIDTDPTLRTLLAEILDIVGFSVISAETGLLGVQYAKTAMPDLIICETLMRGLDGYEVLAALRQESRTAAIPFVFLSIEASRLNMRKAIALGADAYLIKPVTINQLTTAIDQCFDKSAVLARDRECDRPFLTQPDRPPSWHGQ